MTTPAILPSRNEDYGFFRTLTVCPQRDRRSTEVWTIASRLIAEAIRADSEDEMIGIRNFLDSRLGRHFADDVVSNMAGCNIGLEPAIGSTIRRWQGWRIDRKTEREHGIPAGLPYLTGWVQHFAVTARDGGGGMIDLRPLHRQHTRSGALLSGTALCPIKTVTPKRQIVVKGPVASIRIQKQPSQPYPVAKPRGARWIVTINAQTTVDAEQAEIETAPAIVGHSPAIAPSERQTKLTTLIDMLRCEGGATIDEMAAATSWQPNSIRGALSGILKKKLGLDITSEKVEGRGRVYRAT